MQARQQKVSNEYFNNSYMWWESERTKMYQHDNHETWTGRHSKLDKHQEQEVKALQYSNDCPIQLVQAWVVWLTAQPWVLIQSEVLTIVVQEVQPKVWHRV